MSLVVCKQSLQLLVCVGLCITSGAIPTASSFSSLGAIYNCVVAVPGPARGWRCKHVPATVFSGLAAKTVLAVAGLISRLSQQSVILTSTLLINLGVLAVFVASARCINSVHQLSASTLGINPLHQLAPTRF